MSAWLGHSSEGRRHIVAIAAIILAAFNLRPAVTSVGAVLRGIQAETGMSDPLAGVLTSVPVIAFGVVGLASGRIARKLGLAWTVVGSLCVLATGLVVRAYVARPSIMIAASTVALAGIATANVLLPVAVKVWFPTRVGWATGLYTMAMSLGTAAAAGATVPISRLGGSWRFGLAAWTLPVLLALPPWLLLAGRRVPESAKLPKPVPAGVSVNRNRQTWALAVFFGMQSLGAYTVMGWLPTIYRDAGLSATAAGMYLAVVMAVGAPMAISLPVLAARREDQRIVVVVLVCSTAIAYAGLMIAPEKAPALWAVLLGIGFGVFPLALTMIGLRSSTSEGTSQLSSVCQGAGYIIAAGGPVAIVLIHESTGGWVWPILTLLVLLLPQLLAGLVAARPGLVDAVNE